MEWESLAGDIGIFLIKSRNLAALGDEPSNYGDFSDVNIVVKCGVRQAKGVFRRKSQ